MDELKFAKKIFKITPMVKKYKNQKKAIWKFYRPRPPQLIYDGGWHFSFLKKPKEISQKIKVLPSRI